MKDDRIYLGHILECIERIELYTVAGEAHFLSNIQTQDSVYRNFEVIGEASKRIPRSLKDKVPLVPWKDVAGFRDVLIHQYDGVDPGEVWVIIEEELPRLKKAILFLME